MESTITSPVLAQFLFLEWYQWVAIVLLIVLIVVFMKIRNRQA